MSTLTSFGKLPTLNSATILLVGTNEVFQHQLAETILMEKQNLKVNIHLTASLPLPAERDHIRPRIDLIVFMINMQSKHSFTNIEASLKHVDANFFLGKVCFLATGAGRMNQISVEVNAILNLADLYCSPILFCELEVVTQAVDGSLVVDLIFQRSSTGIKGSDLRFATPDQMMLQQQPDPISKPYDSYMHF